MSIKLNGETYYRTQEFCRMVEISRSTLLRWFEDGILNDKTHRDRRGWDFFPRMT